MWVALRCISCSSGCRHLGIDAREYITDLPVQHIQELHITGIHRIEETYIEMARQMGVDEAIIQHVEGRLWITCQWDAMTGRSWHG